MKISIRGLIIIILSLCGSAGFSQKITRVKKSPIICYASAENTPTRVAPPQSFRTSSAARINSANIEVDYNGFSDQARAAFQYAIDVWAGLISSPVKIRVSANWTVLGNGVLGSAGPGFYASDFDGAPDINVAYPGALAEKLAGKDLNDPEEFDIVASFNSNFNWYYNSTGTPAANQYDLISVVLHELGHGLGFVDTYDYVAGVGEYGSYTGGVPFAFDANIENNTGSNLYGTYTSPSADLGSQLVGNNLYYNSPLAIEINGGQRPKIYAPNTWSAGSSIAHLDENTYSSGNINSLMSPQIGAQEIIHDPGPITLNLFKDLGWTTIYINHDPIASTENTSASAFDVVATITPDNSTDYSIEANSIYLNYYTSGDPTIISIPMTLTANPDEYAAQLPAPGGNELDYYYYLSVGDNLDRTITKPGKVNTPLEQPVQGFYKFHVGPDVDAPVITHTPKENITFLESDIQLVAKVVERFDLSSIEVEYSLAGGSQTNVAMAIIDSLTKLDPLTGLTSRHFQVTIPVTSLVDGDEMIYRIVATDNSSNSNVGFEPASDFHNLPFLGMKAIQDTYSNNFDQVSNDFFAGTANDFSITQPSGFNSPAIHSVHPYIEAASIGLDSINYIYTLRVPILVKSTGATIKFDEIALIEPGENGSVFGTSEFYDYVVTEASPDGGATWLPVADGYDARAYTSWLARYNANGNGYTSLFKPRSLNLLDKFNEGDEVLIRFRLFSDPGAAGWGWAIDNLKIQIEEEAPEVILSAEKELEHSLSVYPNPVKENIIVEASGLSSTWFNVQLLNAQGKSLYAEQSEIKGGNLSHVIQTANLSKGVYFVKVYNEDGVAFRKIIKVD